MAGRFPLNEFHWVARSPALYHQPHDKVTCTTAFTLFSLFLVSFPFVFLPVTRKHSFLQIMLQVLFSTAAAVCRLVSLAVFCIHFSFDGPPAPKKCFATATAFAPSPSCSASSLIPFISLTLFWLHLLPETWTCSCILENVSAPGFIRHFWVD